MSIFMTLVIVILMIFFDTLVKIKKLKNCNMNEKKILRVAYLKLWPEGMLL